MEAFVLNQAQRSLVNMLSTVTTEEDTEALRYMLVKFLDFQLQAEMDKCYSNGTVTPDKLKQWSKMHLRTPYNRK